MWQSHIFPHFLFSYVAAERGQWNCLNSKYFKIQNFTFVFGAAVVACDHVKRAKTWFTCANS